MTPGAIAALAMTPGAIAAPRDDTWRYRRLRALAGSRQRLRLSLRAFDERVQHCAPRRGEIAAVVAAAAESHDAPAAQLVRERAQAPRRVAVRLGCVLEMRERIAGDAV